MKILLLTDKQNWAYHSIAKSLIKYNTDDDVSIDTLHIKTEKTTIKKKWKKYDKVLVMGWQNYPSVKFIPKKHCLTGIHSHHSWDDRKTSPEKDVTPSKELLDNLSGFAGVNAVSNRLYDLFSSNGLENLCYTPNGVDHKVFKCKSNEPSDKFSIGYSGSKNHDWRKGVSKFIIPSATKAKVATRLAMLSTSDHIPLDKMPGFYQSIDCYVCASSSEGFSLSVLEAASCGIPIITTAVGGMSELIDDGRNGFVVNRDVGDIADKIIELKNDIDLYRSISKNIRSDIENKWSWEYRAADWIKFITMRSKG